MSTLSVVMGTYNGARFLPQQLASLAAQKTPPAQLIIADDGSTDDTVRIAEAFAQHAGFPVEVHRNESNLGYGENFLRAAGSATSDYIAFCDQDDVWYPEKLTVAVTHLQETGAALFVHPADVIDERDRRQGRFGSAVARPGVHEPLQLPPWSVFYGCMAVFPRRLMTVLDPRTRGRHTFEYDGLLSHDLWIYFVATSLGSVVVHPEALIGYRQHGSNATPGVQRRGVRSWIRSLGLPADPRMRRDDIASHRADLLDRLSSTGDADVRESARRAAVYWRSIARYERARLDFYAAGGVVRRLRGCVTLVRVGGYRRHRRGGLGHRLLLKDVLVGVVRARRVFPGS